VALAIIGSLEFRMFHHVELLDIPRLSGYLCCNFGRVVGGCSEVQK